MEARARSRRGPGVDAGADLPGGVGEVAIGGEVVVHAVGRLGRQRRRQWSVLLDQAGKRLGATVVVVAVEHPKMRSGATSDGDVVSMVGAPPPVDRRRVRGGGVEAVASPGSCRRGRRGRPASPAARRPGRRRADWSSARLLGQAGPQHASHGVLLLEEPIDLGQALGRQAAVAAGQTFLAPQLPIGEVSVKVAKPKT